MDAKNKEKRRWGWLAIKGTLKYGLWPVSYYRVDHPIHGLLNLFRDAPVPGAWR